MKLSVFVGSPGTIFPIPNARPPERAASGDDPIHFIELLRTAPGAVGLAYPIPLRLPPLISHEKATWTMTA